jgi:hypothetical protein
MTRQAVVVEHRPLHLFRYHRDLTISPSELLNGSKRLPISHDQELDTLYYVAPQDRGVDEARDLRESREGLGA